MSLLYNRINQNGRLIVMGYIIYKKENHIAQVTLNRPEAMNAFNSELINELIGAFENIEKLPLRFKL